MARMVPSRSWWPENSPARRSTTSPNGCAAFRSASATGGFPRAASSSRGAGPPSMRRRPAARRCRRSRPCCGRPRPTCSSASATRATTRLTLEAAQAFDGPVWLMTGKAESPLAELADEVIVVTPEVEESYCHTASYTCAVAALDALRGEDVRWLRLAVEQALARAGRGRRLAARSRRRRGSRLAHGAGGRAEAPRGRLHGRPGPPHRADPPRRPGRHRRDRAGVRPRGRGPRGRARSRRRPRAGGDRLADHARSRRCTRSWTSFASSS